MNAYGVAPRSLPIVNTGWVEPAPAPHRSHDDGPARCVVIGKALSRLPSLYLKCLFTIGQRESTIRVDTASIDAARDEVLALWEQGGITFMALYNKQALVLEKSQREDLSLDMARELASLGDLQDLIDTAASHLRSARKPLAVLGPGNDRQNFYRSFETFGTWAAATSALRTELAEKIASLQARQYPITEASVTVSAAAGKCYLKAEACAQWIRDFQSGKIKLDPMSDAFDQPKPITAIIG